MKDKSTVTLLCFFLGGLGVHHYYLGNNRRGILYTIFAITLIPSIVAMIEFISFSTMNSNEFNLKYNSSYIDYSDDEAKHLEVLAKLHELRREGVITEEEYLRKRQKLIA